MLTSHMRIARPVTNLDLSREMYCQGLGMQVLSSFTGHNGFNGVMLGAEGLPWHFEFTHCEQHPVPPAPTPEDLLVLYLPDEPQWRRSCQRLGEAGFERVVSFNPYWDVAGKTFQDHDGYRLVLQNRAWGDEADAGAA